MPLIELTPVLYRVRCSGRLDDREFISFESKSAFSEVGCRNLLSRGTTIVKLNQLMLRLQYRSDDSTLARDLYNRCLPLSVNFDRAVGFFSTSVFAGCSDGFLQFFERNGVMRVVCSPVFNRTDIDALVQGYRDRPALVRKPRLGLLNESPETLQASTSDFAAWLVATGKLDIRIAIRKTSLGDGLYHEKLGLFIDDEHETVAFAGSANESLSALERNFECVDVFRSWETSERRRVEQKRAQFETLWSDETEGLEIVPFPKAARLGLLQARSESSSISAGQIDVTAISGLSLENIDPVTGIDETLSIPSNIKLRPHQKAAVREWFANDGLGILEMATGAGKTIAALAIAAKLYESIGGPLLIVIVCPYLHLAAQWVDVAELFGLEPLVCAISQQRWYEPLSTRLFNLASGRRQLASVVVSNTTFATDAFQNLLQRAPVRTLILGDEVHNLGARNLREILPQQVRYRAGLSATWKRARDPDGTAAIREYFGPPVAEYTLEQAMRDGVLCPYRYNPVLIKLQDEEFDEYLELTERIAKLYQREDDADGDESPILKALLIKRARLLATAAQKIPKLVELLSDRDNTSHNLIYCGDGSIESELDAGIERQIDAVTRAVGHDLNMSAARYIADTPLTARHELRRRFAAGKLQCLVAIRCLDEGVDIPETRRAFILASSTNPRQFIQRRGRILRLAPDKDLAEIFDFIVEPPADVMEKVSPYYEITRRLFRRELYRITEFANLAINGPEAMHHLLPIRDQLGLLDFESEDERD